jgi:hypothetical protein
MEARLLADTQDAGSVAGRFRSIVALLMSGRAQKPALKTMPNVT